MLSLPQIMKEFKCTREEAVLFLNKANELQLLDLSPIEAVKAVVRRIKKDIVKQAILDELLDIVGELLVEDIGYNPNIPNKDLN
jgi:hypothetical protein